MTSTISSRPDSYRGYAQECWQLVNEAADIETKAVFQLTAEAWTMLAEQVEKFEASSTLALPQSARDQSGSEETWTDRGRSQDRREAWRRSRHGQRDQVSFRGRKGGRGKRPAQGSVSGLPGS